MTTEKPRRGGRNFIDKEALNNVWLTPANVLACVRAYAPIGLDPCTLPSNPTRAHHYFTEVENGLEQSWKGYGLVFVNPPYSLVAADKERGVKTPPIRLWAQKIHNEASRGVVVIALLPCGARYSTGYFQDNLLVPELTMWCFVRGRVKFINGATGQVGKGNNYDSQMMGFGVDVERFAAAFAPLGAVFAVKRKGELRGERSRG